MTNKQPSNAVTDPVSTRLIQLNRQSNGQYKWGVQKREIPQLGDHQVLVHIRAASIQHGDVKINDYLENIFGITADISGQIGGSDAAGEVVKVGPLVKSVKPGQQVVSLFFVDYVDAPLTDDKLTQSHGWTTDGVFGDYVVLSETGLAPMPEWMSYEEAATLPSSALTAWSATCGKGFVKKGDVVLVEGTGGVSMFALQFAIAQGAQVIVTSSSDEKIKRAMAMGAMTGINYKKEPDWSARVRELTAGRGADLVIDIGGVSTMAQSLSSVANEGTLALVGGLDGYDASISTYDLITRGISARGVMAGSRADLIRMCAFMTEHQIHPMIDGVFDFEDFQQAMHRIESGNFMGKLVLKM
jgi:NADPH:quinone reductase-like Zn-dependent oxidoreductase